jgi:hypothetical protein
LLPPGSKLVFGVPARSNDRSSSRPKVSKKSPNWGGVCLAVTAKLGAVLAPRFSATVAGALFVALAAALVSLHTAASSVLHALAMEHPTARAMPQ